MTREFKLPPDAYNSRTERGSAKGLVRVAAQSMPEGAIARLPMFMAVEAEGEPRVMFSNELAQSVNELLEDILDRDPYEFGGVSSIVHKAESIRMLMKNGTESPH